VRKLFTIIFFALTNTTAFASDTAQKTCYVVEGMTCAACTVTLKAAVKKLDGISSVSASVEKKSATVEYDPKRTDADAIKKAIDSTGYSAKSTQCSM
jgi:mercuric ion binding protein